MLVLATLMLPSQVTIVPLYVIFVDLHWIGSLKPLIVPTFFGDAFSIFLLRQFFMTIPQELSDAARVDGAGEFRILWRVIIPLAKPGIAAVGLFQFLYAWNDFFNPLLYSGNNQNSITLRGRPDAAAADAAGALRRLVQRVDGRGAAVHDPGADHLLLRAARVHRGRDAHRRQGVTVRVALFGTGWIMRFHARAVLEHPGAELVAAANWREESLARLAEEFAVPRTTTRWEDLAEDPDVDAVVVATPNALHAPQTIACLRAGKHVLVEKPMAATLSEAEAMRDAARASDAFLMVAHCWRFHEDVRRLRDRIAAGELGEVVKTRGYGIHAKWGPSGWFTDPALAGGGALLDMGVHAIDTARFLLGDPQPRRVCAVVGRRYGDYEVDDDGILLITWDNGTNSIVESGWWQPHLAGLEADTEVYGTGGYDRIWPFTEGPPGYEHCAQPMYSAQMAGFLDAIAQGKQPLPSGEDGLVVMRVADEAYRSAQRI